MELAKSDDRKVLLKGGVVFTHFLGCFSLVPSLDDEIPSLVSLLVAIWEPDTGSEPPPDSDDLDCLLDGFLFRSLLILKLLGLRFVFGGASGAGGLGVL